MVTLDVLDGWEHIDTRGRSHALAAFPQAEDRAIAEMNRPELESSPGRRVDFVGPGAARRRPERFRQLRGPMAETPSGLRRAAVLRARGQTVAHLQIDHISAEHGKSVGGSAGHVECRGPRRPSRSSPAAATSSTSTATSTNHNSGRITSAREAAVTIAAQRTNRREGTAGHPCRAVDAAPRSGPGFVEHVVQLEPIDFRPGLSSSRCRRTDLATALTSSGTTCPRPCKAARCLGRRQHHQTGTGTAPTSTLRLSRVPRTSRAM